MALADIAESYITYEARLASFHKSKKRGSTASGRGAKALNWPHKSIAPASLARAGLFFHPSVESPDNVACFLCLKAFDGWEDGDDPLAEHLKHAPDCGWALTTAVESEVGDYATEDPDLPYMKEARKATFAGRWPHEGKKGWKCKTKQLVDAGWRYTPTEDYDDMATCAYCQLALDGWEPSDKPLDEHYNRSPECAFFVLLNEYKASKKSNRAKAGRASKASRLSTQSVATVTSELPSTTDLTMGADDSVMTTTSTMTETTKKGKTKKAPKSRKTKAKKEEPVEIDQVDELGEVEDVAPPSKPKRGKKRDSTTMEDSIDTTLEAPAPKKRATRTRASAAVNNSTLEIDDTGMLEAPAPKKAAGRKKARAKTNRTTSTTSIASAASVSSAKALPGAFPDDDEIERQLEEDLRRPLSEDEDLAADYESEMMRSKVEIHEVAMTTTKQTAATKQSPEYDMLDPSPVDLDDAEVEDELKALQAEMEMDGPVPVPEQQPEAEAEVEPEPEPEPHPQPEQQLHVPKKGRKAGTRKASKQTKPKKAKPVPVVEDEEIALPEPEPETEPVVEAPELEVEEQMHDESLASTGTVVINKASGSGTRSRGRPSKVSLMSQEPSEMMELIEPPAEAPVEEPVEVPAEPVIPPAKRGRGRPSKASLTSQASIAPADGKSAEAPAKRGRGRPKKPAETQKPAESDEPQAILQQSNEDVHVYSAEASEAPEEHAPVVSFEDTPQSPPVQEFTSPQPPSSARHLANPPSTPGLIISPAPSARQAAISPSQSPQSSNAENEPPSSKPAAATTKRVILAPVTATPMRGSPSKRNIVAGLRSTTPWSALDLETVFDSPSSSPNKENGVERFLNKGQNLSSPEKQMTVEEWILFNAAEAEKKLKHECEAMVSKFECEGTNAMRVLEGLIVD